MTPDQLRELIGKATPRGWSFLGGTVVAPDGQNYLTDGGFWEVSDAELVVTLRNLAPKLLELWEAADGLVQALYRERGRLGASAPLNEERSVREVLIALEKA